MNCRDKKIIKLINRKIERKISPAEEKLLQEHLQACPECRAGLKFLENITESVSREKITAPVDLTDKVMEKVKGAGVKGLASEKVKGLPWLRPVPVMAFSIVLLFIISTVSLVRKPVHIVLVKFKVEIPDAREVSLVGDFNDWDEKVTRLKKKNGVWTTELRLKPERYQYMFLVDGQRWMPDPLSSEYIDDGYGNKNSIIDVRRI